MIDAFMPKIEEWVERSNGRVRGDVVFDKLVALGFTGSDRTVRRALARGEVELDRRGRRRRVSAVDPRAGDVGAVGLGCTARASPGGRRCLFCAWLAWSRFRVVIPMWDRTLPTVIACLDRAMRAFGGAPTYWLTDNERTVIDRPHRRDRGPQPADRRRRPPLRGDDRDVRAGRPGVEGRVGVARSGSPRPIWCRPTPTCCGDYGSLG